MVCQEIVLEYDNMELTLNNLLCIIFQYSLNGIPLFVLCLRKRNVMYSFFLKNQSDRDRKVRKTIPNKPRIAKLWGLGVDPV